MYLKSLELFGFKSFAHRTVLTFHRGVTAVVGPNGCGKSNVLDAIRWVLGEQSAKALRGGEMSDVIFSGTDSKQPVGMGEVSLTFAECEQELGLEYHEVCITRRIFRDGRSEYFINKTPSRLRDIHQLFMDTGIGRSAYSIMEQGKIDQILSSRPEERRAVFEEAAGITRYKAQKKEALRKLEYTEANLVRLADIIKEVKRQIGSLQRQAAKARRYQGFMRDIKVLDTHLSHHRYTALAEEMEQSRANAEALAARQAEYEGLAAKHETNLNESRAELTAVEEQLTLARTQAEEIRSRASSARHRIEFSTERIQEAEQLIEKHRVDLTEAEQRLHSHEDQLADADQQIESTISSLKAEEEELQVQNARTSEVRQQRESTENELRQLQNQLSQLESTLASLHSEMNAASNQREAGDTRAGLLRNALAQIEDNHNAVRQQAEEVNQNLEQGRTTLQTARETLSEAEAEQVARQKELGALDSELQQVRSHLSGVDAQLRVLRELNEEGAGLSEGAQALLKGIGLTDDLKTAILGALAGQVEVAPDHITAIEALLGQHLHAVIVRDASVAEHFLTELKNGKSSRAIFSALEWLPQHGELQMETLPEGATAWAADLVKSNGSVTPLIHQLLHRCLVVPDTATALRLRKEFGSITVATLSGELFDEHGLVTAGPVQEGANSILRRKAEIRDLEAAQSSAQNQIAELDQRRQEAELQLEMAGTKVSESREAAQTAQVSVSTLQGQLQLLEKEVQETGGKLNSVRWELENVTKQTEAAQSKITEFESLIEARKEELDGLHSRRNERSQHAEDLARNEQELVEMLNELRIKVTTEQQRRDALVRQRQPMAARLQELRQTITSRQQDIEQYTQRIASLGEDRERLSEQLAADNSQLELVEESLQTAQEKKRELAAGVAELENDLRGLRREVAQAQEAHGKLEVKTTQLQLRTDSLVDHVNHRYQADLTNFRADSYALITTLRELNDRKAGKRKSATTLEPSAESTDSEETVSEENAPATENPDEIGDRQIVANDATEEVVDLEELNETPAVTEQDQAIDWAEVEAFVKELDERLDGIGPVNLDAIQEFDELEERYTFLEEQNNDLQKSKEELLEVISKINKTTRELFAQTFYKVRDNFAEMFNELFGGGKANLLLTDESDPLESGIEIIAKPPGKQLQSISLLSGGEKTMTAVSLLFAIYMVKPSPFCVLDEMDAPLDESNISRFIKLLDRFVQQSQFVVITHNKRTIARAEVLYGVTMEEHGISKLVGVKLAKNDRIELGGEVKNPSIAESFGKKGDLHSDGAPPVVAEEPPREAIAPEEEKVEETSVAEATDQAEETTMEETSDTEVTERPEEVTA